MVLNAVLLILPAVLLSQTRPAPPDGDPSKVSQELTSKAPVSDYSTQNRGRRSLSFRYGYLTEANSNYGAGMLFVETYSLLDAAVYYGARMPDSQDAHKGMRILFLCSWLLMYSSLDSPMGTAYHEMGHGTRIKADGGRPVYFLDDVDGTNSLLSILLLSNLSRTGLPSTLTYELTENLTRGKYYASYVDYFWASLKSKQYSGYTTTLEAYSSRGVSNWDAVITMGGVNNEMYLAELLDDQGYRHGVSFVSTFGSPVAESCPGHSIFRTLLLLMSVT